MKRDDDQDAEWRPQRASEAPNFVTLPEKPVNRTLNSDWRAVLTWIHKLYYSTTLVGSGSTGADDSH
jgi:hypothetical protein